MASAYARQPVSSATNQTENRKGDSVANDLSPVTPPVLLDAKQPSLPETDGDEYNGRRPANGKTHKAVTTTAAMKILDSYDGHTTIPLGAFATGKVSTAPPVAPGGTKARDNAKVLYVSDDQGETS